jgi:hypothetical protein
LFRTIMDILKWRASWAKEPPSLSICRSSRIIRGEGKAMMKIVEISLDLWIDDKHDQKGWEN